MPDLNLLIIFIQVVKFGGFSVAARQLGVTPSAVSKNIAQLERELSMRLFDRTTRELHLTGVGRDFYEKISPLIEMIEKTVEHTKDNMEDPEGLVRVAVGATFGKYYLIPIIADFFVEYPKIKLELDFNDTPRDSLEFGYDIEIRYGQGNKNRYISRRLLSELPLILVAGPLYLARRGVPQSIEDLSQHDYISTTQGQSFKGAEANWKLMRIQDQPITVGRKKKEFTSAPQGGRLEVSSQYDTSLIAALYNIGITSSLLQAALPHLKAEKLKVVLPGYRIKYISSLDNHSQMYIQYPHRDHLPTKVRVFVDYLLKKFRSIEGGHENIDIYAA